MPEKDFYTELEPEKASAPMQYHEVVSAEGDGFQLRPLDDPKTAASKGGDHKGGKAAEKKE